MHPAICIQGLLLICLQTMLSAQQLPTVVSGRIERIENFPSKWVTPRNVDVWLPEGYDGKRKFDVLYMHDGQMLFDSATTWNHQSWDVDDVAARLMHEKKLRDFIVVAVWNIGTQRHADYCPQKPFSMLSEAQKNWAKENFRLSGHTQDQDYQPDSDNYLKFLVQELKPAIDKKYAVRRGRKHTFIAGSSMGGLISIYAICEYPGVFGGAACMSTHWPVAFTLENNPCPDLLLAYLKTHLPAPRRHRIYFDHGDKTLDALYPELQQRVDAVMKEKGFSTKNWETLYFPGMDHSEKSWKARLDAPLLFLLKR